MYIKKAVYIISILLIFSIPSLALDVEIFTTDIQSNAAEAVNISVMVTDNGTPVDNALVNFTTDLGFFSSSSVYSNSSGIAEVTINSTVAGIAHVNASAGNFSNQTTVTFSPLSVSSIIVNADQYQNTAGNITNITFYPKDIYGNINSSEIVNLNIILTDLSDSPVLNTNVSVSGASLTQLDIKRGSIGISTNLSYANTSYDYGILGLNSTVVGNISIIATTDLVSNVTSLEIIPGSPSLLRVVYNDDYTVNTSSSVYASVYDKYENPIENANVTFSVTSPANTVYNSPVAYNSAFFYIYNGLTDINGEVHNYFTTDKRAGDNIINVSVVNTSLQSNITITGLADRIDNFFLTYTPEYALSNNQDYYTLSARPVDQFANPILPLTTPIKEQVKFTTDSGTIILIPLNTQGRANTVVGPTPYVESLKVTATYKNESGYTNFTNSTTLYFTAGPLAAMDLYSVPNAVLEKDLSGNHESEISLVALDEWGHALPNVHILLNNTNTTVGTLEVDGINSTNIINATTDSEGRIHGIFTGNVSGNTTILATSDSYNVSTNISVKAEPFLSVYLNVNPSSVTSGSLVNITTIISVEGELPITRPAASAMLVLDRSGSMDPDYYAGTPLDVVLVLDRSGSMAGTPLADAKEAAKEFVDNLVSNSEVGVVSFSTTSRVDLGMTLLNSYDNRTPVYSAIDSLTTYSSTAMGEGMADANDLLINHARSDTRKVMIVLTDGKTNYGDDRDGDNAVATANSNGITIYTIGLGSDLDESLLRHIASETGGTYYNAPDSSELSTIYNTIAQELSDYDISDIKYGVEGFTPYDYTFHDSLVLPGTFQDTFFINETINDLKVQLDWISNSSDVHLQLTSPSGKIYGFGNDTTGYYPNGDTSEYIWIQPLSYIYPDDDSDTVEKGNWTVSAIGSGTGTEDISISTYVDKKSAAKLSSHAFMSSFDESRGDKAGLALYSFEDIVSSDTQTSYVLDNSTWVGYFTVETSGFYNFNVSWNDGSSINAYLYNGIDLLDSAGGTDSCEVSYSLSAGNTYYIEVAKGPGSVSDTEFTVSVTTSPQDSIMTAYYESNYYSGGGTPKFRTWDGSEWSGEQSANYIGGSPYHVVLESNPLSSEVIMVTGDDQRDVNVQVWDGSEWSPVKELSTELNVNSKRGFDVKYEHLSGDAILVYMNRYVNSGIIPQYQVWNGSSWSTAAEVDGTNAGTGKVGWVKLAADPTSDNMVLVTQDDSGRIRAQLWDGSSWGNSHVVTDGADGDYQSFDVVYDKDGRAMVIWADWSVTSSGHGWHKTYTCDVNVHSSILYNGMWSSNSLGSFSYPVSSYSCWIKAASDPNSDNIIMALNDAYNIYAATWDGSTWSGLSTVESNVAYGDVRSVDVTFEHSSGKGMLVWGDSTSIPKYEIWDGSGWSSKSSALDFGGWWAYTCWVQLTPDSSSDNIFLMTSDNYGDLNIQMWDGSSWNSVSEVESSSTSYYECFDIVFNVQGSSSESTPVSWNQWTGSVTSTFNNDSLSHLENAIDTITADGLTAIDEGLYLANNELSSVDGNSTIVVMTDGLDNAGYHSLLEEAYRARDNNTVIYTVGFGNSEADVDPILQEIATITGGEYYFAPNSSVLKDIFQGIAMQITNFSAGGPVLDLCVPYNYITPLAVAKASYQSGSSNSTTGNLTYFETPTAPATGNAEPTITQSDSTSSLEWQLPNMGAGDKWGVWYQMKVDGAGYVPIIMPTSTVTYTDLSGENITVVVGGGGSASVGGGAAGVSSYLLGSLDMVPDSKIMLIDNSTTLTLTLEDTLGNSSYAFVYLYSNIGYFGNYENPINVTVVGSDTVDFTSAIAGRAYITAYAYNINNMSDVLVARDVLAVRPKGMISIS